MTDAEFVDLAPQGPIDPEKLAICNAVGLSPEITDEEFEAAAKQMYVAELTALDVDSFCAAVCSNGAVALPTTGTDGTPLKLFAYMFGDMVGKSGPERRITIANDYYLRPGYCDEELQSAVREGLDAEPDLLTPELIEKWVTVVLRCAAV